MSNAIVLVEDEDDIRDLLCLHFKHAGFDVYPHASAETAMEVLRTKQIALCIIDWMLPGESGISLAKRVRADKTLQQIPLIMLTARGREGDKLEGFEAGFDDFVTKPFSPRELLARVKSVLKRTGGTMTERQYRFGELVADTQAQRVLVGNKLIPLSPTEYRILLAFLQSPERVLTRDILLAKAWPNDRSIDERTVDVHIRRLRMSLRPFSYDTMIETVRSGGYRLALEQQAAQT